MITLIDFMNTLFLSSYFIKENFNKETLLVSFFNLLNSLFKTYGKIIICSEGSGSLEWRRTIYPNYKRNRDVKKNEENYKIIKSSIPIILEILQYYPCKVIMVDKCEADDVIYALSEKYKETLVISNDSDLVQLMNFFPEVKIYNIIKKCFLKQNKYIIEQKAIIGDSSDGIPGLYKIGEKTFQKMLEDVNLYNKKMSNGNLEAFNMFKKIIDLRECPFKQNILDKENKKEYNVFNVEEIENLYFKYKLKDLNLKWGYVSAEIQDKIRC